MAVLACLLVRYNDYKVSVLWDEYDSVFKKSLQAFDSFKFPTKVLNIFTNMQVQEPAKQDKVSILGSDLGEQLYDLSQTDRLCDFLSFWRSQKILFFKSSLYFCVCVCGSVAGWLAV